MDTDGGVEAWREMFAQFAATAARRAPLYGRLAAGIAADDELIGLLAHAPATQRQPVLLFACVHDLLLADSQDPLAMFYPDLSAVPSGGDPLPAFRRFCDDHRAELAAALATRSTQTNEIGRCAALLPAFGLVADEVGALAHLDVGASAGLNLLLDHYAYRYEPGGAIGGPSTVLLECGTRGAVPLPTQLPRVVARLGLDRSPVDVNDAAATRWLEACVWPDQPDRLDRLRAALALVRDAGITVRRGDAVTDLPVTVDELAGHGHPVITNTWVLNYLTPDARRAYLDALDALGRRMDLTWIFLESPRLIPELPIPTDKAHRDRSVLTMVRWRDGGRSVDHLATAHPHGYWVHWNGAR